VHICYVECMNNHPVERRSRLRRGRAVESTHKGTPRSVERTSKEAPRVDPCVGCNDCPCKSTSRAVERRYT